MKTLELEEKNCKKLYNYINTITLSIQVLKQFCKDNESYQPADEILAVLSLIDNECVKLYCFYDELLESAQAINYD